MRKSFEYIKKMKLGIFKEFTGAEKNYILACEELGIEYEIIDIISNDWIDKIKDSDCDGFLVRPSAAKEEWKKLYDERLYFVNKKLGIPIYPSYDEIFIYENKRMMSYWLKFKEIPMPETYVFYDKDEALRFLDQRNDFPLIFKPNVGSAAIGIKFVKNKRQGKRLVNKMFTKWRFFNRGYTKWYMTKYKIPYPIMDDKQYNNVLFQEQIDIKYEWRGVKIGKSYFAHKKLADDKGLHSGSGKANYDSPPLEVMDFIKYVCDVSNFSSMNVDFFEDHKGNFYVNELQTIFGSRIKPYQMCVDGEPGRYLYINDEWVFEKGMFNQNNSCNLRIEDFILKLKKIRNNDNNT